MKRLWLKLQLVAEVTQSNLSLEKMQNSITIRVKIGHSHE